MKTVLPLSFFGLLLGSLPGLVYRLRVESAWTDNRLVFFALIACYSAIFSAILGATHAIITGYDDRNKEPSTPTEEHFPGFWADILTIWNPPVGHARRDWRHRMEFRRYQLIQGSIMLAVILIVSAALYFFVYR